MAWKSRGKGVPSKMVQVPVSFSPQTGDQNNPWFSSYIHKLSSHLDVLPHIDFICHATCSVLLFTFFFLITHTNSNGNGSLLSPASFFFLCVMCLFIKVTHVSQTHFQTPLTFFFSCCKSVLHKDTHNNPHTLRQLSHFKPLPSGFLCWTVCKKPMGKSHAEEQAFQFPPSFIFKDEKMKGP